jgi:competence protein ComEC
MYYSLAGAVLSGWTFRDRSSRLMTIVGAVAFIIAGSAFYLGGRAPTLTALDVGGGQAVVIDQPGDNDLLVDGGRRSQGDSVVRTFLRMRGMDRLHTVLLTVNDINHAGGLISTVQHVRFGQFCESGFKSRSKDHKELVELLSEDHSLQILKAGMEFDLSPSLRLKILHPTGETRFATADDNSVVFQLICEQLAILFKSDIGESVEKTLVANGADLRSRILITSQHPKETCCIDAFLDRVEPEVVILNAGSFPTYAYPRQEVVERLQRRHIRLYRTDECGGIVVTIHRGSYTIRPTIEVPGDMQRP